jgi:hypothetical protein
MGNPSDFLNNLGKASKMKDDSINGITSGVTDFNAPSPDQCVAAFGQSNSTRLLTNMDSYISSTLKPEEQIAASVKANNEMNAQATKSIQEALTRFSTGPMKANMAQAMIDYKSTLTDPSEQIGTQTQKFQSKFTELGKSALSTSMPSSASIAQTQGSYGDLMNPGNLLTFSTDSASAMTSDIQGLGDITTYGNIPTVMSGMDGQFTTDLQNIINTDPSKFTDLATVLSNKPSYGDVTKPDNFLSFQNDSFEAITTAIEGGMSGSSRDSIDSMMSSLSSNTGLLGEDVSQLGRIYDAGQNNISTLSMVGQLTGSDTSESIGQLTQSLGSVEQVTSSFDGLTESMGLNMQQTSQLGNFPAAATSIAGVQSVGNMIKDIQMGPIMESISELTNMGVLGNTADQAENITNMLSSMAATFPVPPVPAVRPMPGDTPIIIYEPDKLQFICAKGSAMEMSLYIINAGNLPLTVKASCTNKNFVVKNTSLTVPPLGGPAPLTIKYIGGMLPIDLAMLKLEVNDPIKIVMIQMRGYNLAFTQSIEAMQNSIGVAKSFIG